MIRSVVRCTSRSSYSVAPVVSVTSTVVASVRCASTMARRQHQLLPSFTTMMSQTILRPSTPVASAAIPSSTATPAMMMPKRDFMCTFGDVKVGWIVKHDSRLLQVMKMSRAQYQQREPVIAMETRDVQTGKKAPLSMSPGSKTERILTEIQSYTLLYRQGDTFHVMNGETFEQSEIDVSYAGELAAYFQDGQTVVTESMNDSLVAIRPPDYVDCVIAQTDSIARDKQGGGKNATLDNGRVITVPMHLSKGETVKVKLIDGIELFSERVKTRS